MSPVVTPSVPDLFPPALVHFVFSPDPFQKSDFPRDLTPQQVEHFVRAKINPTVPAPAFEQLFLVIDHYDVHEAVPQLLDLTEPKAASPLQRPADRPPAVTMAARLSIIKTAVVAGIPRDRARAAELFRGASNEVSVEDYPLCEQAVETYEVGSLDLDPNSISERLRAAAAPLAKYEASPDPADAGRRRRYGEMDGLQRRLLRAKKTSTTKRAILNIPDRRARLQVLVRLYLDLPTNYAGYLVDWSARQLRRESWALQPAAQIERVFKPDLRAEIASDFRATLSEILPGDPPDPVKEKQRVAALDAVLYFNGPTSDEERRFLASTGEGYVMPLSLRQVWPQH